MRGHDVMDDGKLLLWALDDGAPPEVLIYNLPI